MSVSTKLNYRPILTLIDKKGKKILITKLISFDDISKFIKTSIWTEQLVDGLKHDNEFLSDKECFDLLKSYIDEKIIEEEIATMFFQSS